ncbi:MAG: hypothetical protein L0228_01480 [Planctomycetes bacterium]|nr:hypothetical protein [Planctomycetota bacterium]
MEKLTAKSDPVFQAQIQTIFNALQQPGVDPRNNVDAFREVQTLKKLTDDKDELVKQLAIFVATTKSEEDTHVLIALMILHSFDLPPRVPIRVLAPYLDTDDRQLRDFARIWFGSHDNADAAPPQSPPLQPVNYRDYLEYVQWKMGRNEEVPDGFVRYIYERSPGRALLVFAYASGSRDVSARLQVIRKAIEARQQGKQPEPLDVTGQQVEERRQARSREKREIRLAEHIVSNAIWLKENEFAERFQAALPEANAELAKLAKHKEWWARLYVAWVMRQHRELRAPAIVQQLSADSDALVSKTAKSIEK